MSKPSPVAGSSRSSVVSTVSVVVSAPTARVASSVEVALDRYVAAVMAVAQRTTLVTMRSLAEPRAPGDPARALRVVEQLVEALAGFVVGASIGPLARRLRHAGSEPLRSAVNASLHALSRPGAPSALPVREPAPAGPRFLPDAHMRPLVDELGSRMCARLPYAHGEARVLLRSMLMAAERSDDAARTISTLTVALSVAAGDVAWLGERLTPAVTEAWMHATAVMHGTPLTSGIWATWSRRAAGVPEPQPTLTTPEVVAAGFVMRIG
jgi:hypothetical protein